MSFDTISALEIPQEATELTTSDLKLICGGWEGNNDCNKNNDNNECRSRRRKHHHHRKYNQCDE